MTDEEHEPSERPSLPEVSWVVVRKFDSPVLADLAINFLKEQGIPVTTYGNTGQNAVLDRFGALMDIRVAVPTERLEEAREALAAMEIGPGREQPFRGRTAIEEPPMRAPRRWGFAVFLAFVFPFGAG